jgi:hypothetical protein
MNDLLQLIPLLFVISLLWLIPIVVVLAIVFVVKFFKYLWIFTADIFKKES